MAHELFFLLNGKEWSGHEALIVADTQAQILHAFRDDGQMIYEHNEQVYDEYINLSEPFLRHVQSIVADEKGMKKAKRRVTTMRKLENDEKIQKKYWNIKVQIQPWIAVVCETKDLVAPFSITDLEKIAFAGACSSIVREIRQVENYLAVRNESSCVDEKKETFLWESFVEYNNMAKKALDHRISYNKFLDALEALIRDKQYVPR